MTPEELLDLAKAAVRKGFKPKKGESRWLSYKEKCGCLIGLAFAEAEEGNIAPWAVSHKMLETLGITVGQLDAASFGYEQPEVAKKEIEEEGETDLTEWYEMGIRASKELFEEAAACL